MLSHLKSMPQKDFKYLNIFTGEKMTGIVLEKTTNIFLVQK